jgi:hypothetical protein
MQISRHFPIAYGNSPVHLSVYIHLPPPQTSVKWLSSINMHVLHWYAPITSVYALAYRPCVLFPVFGLFVLLSNYIAFFATFSNLHNDPPASPVFVDVCTDTTVYSPHTYYSSIFFKSYMHFIRLIWYRMSIVISNEDLESKYPLNWSFEIRNGLLGVKRDRFLSLIGYMHFNKNDNKIRNVWKNYFFLLIFFFFS